MISRIRGALKGDGLKARAMRGGIVTLFETQGENLLRLLSNLVLTRLLFPEAFGLMAIVQVFMAGLNMFSDIGIKTSIIQSPRGDDPDFLNTAWTLQIIRGVVIWFGGCLLAWPAAWLYDAPMLMQLLPVAALTALLSGFQTTKAHSANRNLILGRMTALSLGAQIFGAIMMILLAYLTESVWSLVIGGLLGMACKVWLWHAFLPGETNRLRLQPQSVREIVKFGKYIFLSTAAAFVINQGDRAILAAFLPLATLGIYNIGWFLSSVPFGLSRVISNKVVFPLYRMRHPADGEDNRKKMFNVRRLVVAGSIAISSVFAFGGIFLVDILYEPRYALAGPVVVLMSFTMVPTLVCEGTINAALAKGDSRSFFLIFLLTALLQVLFVYLGARYFGIFGAVLGIGGAMLATYPIRSWIIQKYRSWDALGDALLFTLGFGLNGFACWLHWDHLMQLLPAN
jgi:O-antigen/teichoic acid export membrane protein